MKFHRSQILTTALLTVMALAMSALGCAQVPILPQQASCDNIDWFDIGRNDGASGVPLSKIEEYQLRCDTTPAPVDAELYTNGRNAGLVDFCSSRVGIELGKRGEAHHDVCPEPLRTRFLEGYDIGNRIRLLERENADLQARIDRMVRTVASATPTTTPTQVQLENLRKRKNQINAEIASLESRSGRSR